MCSLLHPFLGFSCILQLHYGALTVCRPLLAILDGGWIGIVLLYYICLVVCLAQQLSTTSSLYFISTFLPTTIVRLWHETCERAANFIMIELMEMQENSGVLVVRRWSWRKSCRLIFSLLSSLGCQLRYANYPKRVSVS